MADAKYDVVIIGGGSKALITAIYLAKYGQLSVAMFEARHELGGGWASHEAPAPGFIGDTHSSTLSDWYYVPVQQDFPDFEEKGAKFAHYKVALGGIFKEDHSCLTFYHREYDPTGELTAKEIARFSKRDAETYLLLRELYNKYDGEQNFLEDLYNLPPKLGELSIREQFYRRLLADPKCPVDSRWFQLSVYQAGRELWESPAIRALHLRRLPRVRAPDAGGLADSWFMLLQAPSTMYAVGGTHNIAHACQRILMENGGKFFTKSEVDKIIIENGKARGIKLVDGSEIEAAKAVISEVDPYQLCFRLIGKENLPYSIVKKIENLERRFTAITWYTWAVHELPRYKAAAFNPDINDTHWMVLGDMDDEFMLRSSAWRRLNKMPPERDLVVWAMHSAHDKTRAPEGKHTISTEEMVVPADAMSEREWMEYKKKHADETIKYLLEYAPNMTWENVIGFDAITPYDIAKRNINMAPTGNWAVIDDIPGQTGKYRPIIELADHRTPIKNLYATGAAWPTSAGAHAGQGYRCYKAMADDLGLRKPWVEKARPF